MKKLNDNEMKNIIGGGFSGNLWNALTKGFSIFSDMGRYVGSAIRRLLSNNICNL